MDIFGGAACPPCKLRTQGVVIGYLRGHLQTISDLSVVLAELVGAREQPQQHNGEEFEVHYKLIIFITLNRLTIIEKSFVNKNMRIIHRLQAAIP